MDCILNINRLSQLNILFAAVVLVRFLSIQVKGLLMVKTDELLRWIIHIPE